MEEELKKQVKEKVEEQIKLITQDGLEQEKPTNLERLYKLIDIHKDIENEVYWKEKIMRYREYGEESYGRRGVPGTGRGRYSAGGNYGRRGVDSRYRGEDIMNDMYQNYQEYSDGKEMYGADSKTIESFKYMIKSFKDYYKHLKDTASSQEETQILDQAIDEMARM